MSLEPDIFIDLTIAMMRGVLEEQLDVRHMAQLLYMAAQPETNAEVHDVLDEVKSRLTNWTQDDLDGVREVLIVQITLPCLKDPDDDKCHRHEEGHHHHIAQVVRLATRPGWHWDEVHANRVHLDDVVAEVGYTFLPEGHNREHVVLSSPNLGNSLRDLIKQSPLNVEREVDEFRSELDRLFPTQDEGG